MDSDNKRYSIVDSLIDINNIKVNVDSCGYDKMYIDEDLKEDKPHQLADQFNERKINHRNFYSELLDNMHPFIVEISEIVRYYLLPSSSFLDSQV